MKGGTKIYRGSASGARNYVEAERSRADDYYLAEGTGFAEGYEASAEGVVRPLAQMDSDAYEAWVAGIDPGTGELRGRVRQDKRAVRFAEVVVNGPKSWSLAAELHPDIAEAYEAAQDRAAENIMAWMGQHATTRTGPRGAQVATPVQRLEAVTVRHYTNRAGDPHRHLHLQVNARVEANGKWYGIDTVAVRDSIDAVHGIGHATVVADPQFRQALAAHGFTLDEAGEIVQLTPYVGPFSQRAEQIGRQVDRYEAEWRAANPDTEPGPRLRRAWDARAWVEDRPDKGTPLPAEQARARWVDELRRLGYTDPAPPAPDLAPQVGGIQVGDIDRDAAAAEVVARLGTAGSAWNHPQIRGETEQLIARELVIADPAARGELAEDIAARAVVLCRPLLDRDVPDHIRALTSPHVLEVHEDLTGRLAVRGAARGTDADLTDVARAAQGAGVDLDERQAQAAEALAGDHALIVVQGAAGAGKTTTLATARDTLAEQGHDLVVVTPTLKAAKVAGAELGTTTGTAARLARQHGYRWDDTGWRRLQAGDIDPGTGKPWRGPDPAGQLRRGDLLVVDEAGMLDQDTARALLTIADEQGVRVALLGDPHQLPAVGRGGVLDMAQRWTDSITDLTVIHRFTHETEIAPGITGTVPDTDYAALSLRLRHGDDPAEVFTRLQARGQVHRYDSPAERDAAIAAEVIADRRGGRAGAVVVDTREQAARLNAEIREQLVDAGLVDDTSATVTSAGQRIGAGDTIATRRNDVGADVANRDQWTVTAVDPDGALHITSPAGDRTLPAGYVAEHVELAYATTAYGVQGQTTTTAHLVLSEHTDATAAYVAMTRGRTSNDVHIVAGADLEAQAQWVDAFGRGRADLGVDAARADAERAAAGYATGEPVASPDEQLAALLDELHQAWTDQDRAHATLDRLEPRLARASESAQMEAREAEVLDPLRERYNSTTAAADRAARNAEIARALLERRADAIAGDLTTRWDNDRGLAGELGKTVLAGPGRFGIRSGPYTEAAAELQRWAEMWAPVIGDQVTASIQDAARFATQPPWADGIADKIAGYAEQRAATEMPVQATQVNALPDLRDAAKDASDEYQEAAREIRRRQAARSAWTGYHDMARDLPRLEIQTEQARTAAADADTRVDQLTRDPALATRPDAGQILEQARGQWTTDRAVERLAAQRRLDAAHAQDLDNRHRRHEHDLPTYGHSPDLGGPSIGR